MKHGKTVLDMVLKCILSTATTGMIFTGCSSDTSKEESPELSISALASATLYNNGLLGSGWRDISKTTHKLNSTTVLYQGLHTLSFTMSASGWVAFESTTGLSGNDSISFYVYGGANTSPKISSEIKYGGNWSSNLGYAVPSIGVYCDGGVIPTNAWTHCTIPISIFGVTPTTVVQGVSFDGTGKNLKVMAFSTIQLVSSVPQGTGGTSSTGGTATGGSVSTGGTATGGTATGGRVSTGGTATGGTATGGSVSTGGTATGGTATGGTATGGRVSTGGSTNLSTPITGAHVLAEQDLDQEQTTLVTLPVDTQSTGSAIIASISRGVRQDLVMLPSDNMQNSPYVQLGSSIFYVGYPDSGAGLYSFMNASGGIGHTFQTIKGFSDEATMIVVEVKNAQTIQAVKGAYVTRAAGNKITSPSVTTTGPATIVAFCWSDYASSTNIISVNNSFQLLDQYNAADGMSIQGASATRDVTEAGTYNVTWTIQEPIAGAIVYIVAVQ